MSINFKLKTRAAVVYSLGLISGVGIVAASIVGATDSSIPYTFQDGQVISADTMNDLFGRIKMSNEGFANISDLDGAWSCTTYDFSGQTPTSGMPNSQFATDSATGFQAITQTWTFSNGSLSMDKLHLGGVAANNTGIYWPNATTLAVTVAGSSRVQFSSNINSTSNTTGALTVAGGAGIAGNINAGGNAGLRVGDKLMLADASVLPRHTLEPSALDAAVLAEVKSVSPYQAEIKQVAGRKQKFNGAWVAWPYTY